MSPELVSILRSQGLTDLAILTHPVLGLTAAKGRYDNLYARDLERFIQTALSHPLNFSIPGLVDSIQFGLDWLVRLQGQKIDPTTGEFPGKILHEYADSLLTPYQRLAELRKGGLPVKERPDGSLFMVSYFANDSTSGFIGSVSRVAKTKKEGNEQRDYLQRMFPAILSAWTYEIDRADIDQDGLIESTLKNDDHNERDSQNSYDLEDGGEPQGPGKYLSTNCIHLDAARELVWMANQLDQSTLSKEAKERYKVGLRRLNELFWDPVRNYPVPLVYTDNQRVDFVNDEALDGMFFNLWTKDQNRAIADHLSQPEWETMWGQRTKSRLSNQYFENGPQAYWNGPIWPYRVGWAASSYQRADFAREARIKHFQYYILINRFGHSELKSLDDNQNPVEYNEGNGPIACRPLLFSVGTTLGITAQDLATVVVQPQAA